MTILERIRAEREEAVAAALREMSLREMAAAAGKASPPRDFIGALSGAGGVKLIAEIKRASPSAGLIRPDFSPALIARAYAANGAAALSVLTEPRHFQGALEYLREARAAAELPLLRKDFIFCEYQLLEARAAGADAALLIAAMLSDAELRRLLRAAKDIGLAALVESHDAAELGRALAAGARIIGINNRDLRTMKVDIETTFRLLPRIGGGRIVVSESGIRAREDMLRLEAAGVNAALVGESLMRQADPGRAAAALLGRS